MAFTHEPETTLEQLRTVTDAFIDSSSIIYATKAGALEVLTQTIGLCTLPGVVTEVGYPVPGITIVPETNPGIPVDDQLIEAAESSGSALISEDRKLLIKADSRGMDTYNMLVMLELMLLRGTISLVKWDNARKRLLAAAHYGAWVVHAGNQLHWAVRKEIG